MEKMEELGKRGQQSTNIRASARPQDGTVFQQWTNARNKGEADGSSLGMTVGPRG